jgi:hypothetical protein
MSTQTYSSLRSDLRHEESKTEIGLAELSSLTNSAPTQQDTEIEDRLLQIFAQRRETIDTMSRLVENDPSGGGARVHQVSRAREILVEHEKEFRRMKVSLVCDGALICLVGNSADERSRGVEDEYEAAEVDATGFRYGDVDYGEGED